MITFSETEKIILIGNRHVELQFDKTNRGALLEIRDMVAGHRFVQDREAKKTLFRVAVRTFPDQKIHWLDSCDAARFSYSTTREPGKLSLCLNVADFPASRLAVTVTVALTEDSPLSVWNMHIANGDPTAVFNLTCPVISGLFKLGEPTANEAIIVGRQGEGFLFENPFPVVDHLPLKMGIAPDVPRVGVGKLHGMYPGSQQMQFILYNCSRSGLYLATHDVKGNFKSFDLDRMPDWQEHPTFAYSRQPRSSTQDLILEPPVLSISHFPGESVGRDVTIDYDTMLGVFRGDWHEGADIYKDWARKQWWCAKKLKDQDIPDWLRKGFGMFLFSNFNGVKIGQVDHSLEQIATFTNELSREIGKPILTPIFNWEGCGPWTSPVGLFPPREGAERFRAAMARLREAGNLGAVSIPEDEWYLKLPFQPHAPDFDCWKDFNNAPEKTYAVKHSDGELYIRRLLEGWEQIQLCPFTGELKDFAVRLYKQCLAHGISIIWNGGFPDGGDYSCCYDPAHGHPLGFGSWWSEKHGEILAAINRECRAINPDFVHAGEGICELFIPHLHLYDNRAGMFEVFSHLEENLPHGGRLIPLFNYVYGEYLGAFSAPTPECNRPEVLYWARCFGKSLAQGVVPVGSWCYPEPDALNRTTFDFYKRITRAATHECWKYIIFGEMLKPPAIDVPIIEFSYLLGGVNGTYMDGHARHVVKDVSVEHGSFRAPDGMVGHIFVNVSTELREFDVTLPACGSGAWKVEIVENGRRRNLYRAADLPTTERLRMEPLSVLLIEMEQLGN